MIHKKEKWMLLFLLCCMVALLGLTEGEKDGQLQHGIAQKVIRFHVLAESNQEKDQAQKLKVKNVVVSYMQKKLNAAENIEDARKIVKKNLKVVKAIAEETLKKNGENKSVKVYLAKKQFPIKQYGEFIFPAGIYETLQVEIGRAKGRNWWCVMFPSLCMIDESYTVVPKEAKEKLEKDLTKEEYERIQSNDEIEYKSKLKEWWEGIDYFF